MKTSLLAILVFVMTASFAAPVRARDGVLEVNQACIDEEGNCFPTSGAGYPLQLHAGSFRLTSNIVVPDANTEAIRMYKGSTLDMNGFSLIGPTTCTGAPAVCTGTGNGVGIRVIDGYATIRNGRIAGFGASGIRGDTATRVENVVLEGNGADGLNSQGAAVQVIHCKALRNGNDGFFAAYQGGAAVMMIGNTAVGNGGNGFDVSNGLFLDNAAHQNGSTGLNAAYQDTDSALARNVAGSNGAGAADDQIDGGFHFGPNVCGTVVCPP